MNEKTLSIFVDESGRFTSPGEMSRRIQRWIGRSSVASAIMLLVVGSINYFLTGKPIF